MGNERQRTGINSVAIEINVRGIAFTGTLSGHSRKWKFKSGDPAFLKIQPSGLFTNTDPCEVPILSEVRMAILKKLEFLEFAYYFRDKAE